MYADTTSTIAALSSLILAFGVLLTAYGTYRNGQINRDNSSRIKDVQYQVTTLNGKTIAVLADDNESRRIYTKAQADRTEGDKAHIANVPPPQ